MAEPNPVAGHPPLNADEAHGERACLCVVTPCPCRCHPHGGVRAAEQDACPSDACPMCTGEKCNKCGAGRYRNPLLDGKPCEHDVLERHDG